MFYGMGEIDFLDVEYRFNLFFAVINGFGQIFILGFGILFFGDVYMNFRGGVVYYGFDENGMFGKYGVVFRGVSKG